MSTERLMIDNYVLEHGKPVQVDAFSKYGELLTVDESFDDGYRRIENAEGSPLTPDWLQKFGFITLDAETDIVIWGMDDNSSGEEFSIESDGLDSPTPLYFAYDLGYGEKRKEIKYAHQLQNPYFLLMDKELTITP